MPMYTRDYYRERPPKPAQAQIPVTWTLVALFVVTSLALIAQRHDPFPLRFIAHKENVRAAPWTLLTWTVAGTPDTLRLLFSGLIAWWVLGSLERLWGKKALVGFFIGTNLLAALTFWAGSVLLNDPGVLGGLGAAITPAVVAWYGTLRGNRVSLWGAVTVPVWVLLGLAFVGLWVEAGGGLSGLFALSGCGFAYWYATGGQRIIGGFGGGKRRKPRKTHLRLSEEPMPVSEEKMRKVEEMMRRSGFKDD